MFEKSLINIRLSKTRRRIRAVLVACGMVTILCTISLPLASCSTNAVEYRMPEISQSAQQSSPINSETNFKTLTYNQVADMLAGPDSIVVEPFAIDDFIAEGNSPESAKQKYITQENVWENDELEAKSQYNDCESRSGQDYAYACAQVIGGHIASTSRPYIETLFALCGANRSKINFSNTDVTEYCENLMLTFISVGNGDAARAVLEKSSCSGLATGNPACWKKFATLDPQTQKLIYPDGSGSKYALSILSAMCYIWQRPAACSVAEQFGVKTDWNRVNASISRTERERAAEQQREAAKSAMATTTADNSDQQSNINQSNQATDNIAPQSQRDTSTLDAVKAVAAQMRMNPNSGVNTTSPYKQTYNPTNTYQAPAPSYQSHSPQQHLDNTSAASTENGNQSGTYYSGPSLQSCVNYFYDAGQHLTFKNGCNEAVYLEYTFSGNRDYMSGEAMPPGGTVNSWMASSVLAQTQSKVVYYVCPQGYTLVDENGSGLITYAETSQTLRCWKP